MSATNKAMGALKRRVRILELKLVIARASGRSTDSPDLVGRAEGRSGAGDDEPDPRGEGPVSQNTQLHVLTSTEDFRRELEGRVRGRHVLELGMGTGALTQLILDAGAIPRDRHGFLRDCGVRHRSVDAVALVRPSAYPRHLCGGRLLPNPSPAAGFVIGHWARHAPLNSRGAGWRAESRP